MEIQLAERNRTMDSLKIEDVKWLSDHYANPNSNWYAYSESYWLTRIEYALTGKTTPPIAELRKY